MRSTVGNAESRQRRLAACALCWLSCYTRYVDIIMYQVPGTRYERAGTTYQVDYKVYQVPGEEYCCRLTNVSIRAGCRAMLLLHWSYD